MNRLVRFEDVYLAHFDVYGTPCWVPRDEARQFFTKKQAHNAARKARKYEGSERGIVVVRIKGTATVSPNGGCDGTG